MGPDGRIFSCRSGSPDRDAAATFMSENLLPLSWVRLRESCNQSFFGLYQPMNAGQRQIGEEAEEAIANWRNFHQQQAA